MGDPWLRTIASPVLVDSYASLTYPMAPLTTAGASAGSISTWSGRPGRCGGGWRWGPSFQPVGIELRVAEREAETYAAAFEVSNVTFGPPQGHQPPIKSPDVRTGASELNHLLRAKSGIGPSGPISGLNKVCRWTAWSDQARLRRLLSSSRPPPPRRAREAGSGTTLANPK